MKINKGFGRVGLAAVFGFLDFKAGAEIGVEGGNFSHILAKNNPGAMLYSIDPWHNKANYHKAVRRLGSLDNVKIIKALSADAVKEFDDGSLDYVYIDAAHDYENVMHDITHWSEKVRAGGIVSGHDYNTDYPGVIRAVDEYAAANGINPVYVLRCTSFYWVKQ